MADADETTTPADDGRAHVNKDGTVHTGDRPAWVWCSDPDTGHRFDVQADRLPRKGCDPVEGYPLHFGALARNAKPRREIDGAGPVEPGAPEDITPGDQAAPVADAGVVEAGNGDDQATDVDQPAGDTTTGKRGNRR